MNIFMQQEYTYDTIVSDRGQQTSWIGTSRPREPPPHRMRCTPHRHQETWGIVPRFMSNASLATNCQLGQIGTVQGLLVFSVICQGLYKPPLRRNTMGSTTSDSP